MAAGAAYAVATVVLGYGVALRTSAPAWRRRWPPLGVALIAWAVADGVGLVAHSPVAAWGNLGVAPDTLVWTGAIAVVVSLACGRGPGPGGRHVAGGR